MIEVLMFTAPWCAPCKPVARALADLAPRFPSARFAEVDVDDEPETGMRFGVLTLPTVVILRDDEAVAVIDGARPRADYERALEEVLPAAGGDALDA
ncbi:MAG TPA: thioredoxin family protein [Gaiellaceae bacterium]|nr:thioredoxin family protein [Gaiellaceae bacterium]